jgi:hypothetical protein
MNPLCVFFAVFALLSLVRARHERRKYERLARLVAAALRERGASKSEAAVT